MGHYTHKTYQRQQTSQTKSLMNPLRSKYKVTLPLCLSAKTDGKLRSLIDFKRNDHHKMHDQNEHNHSVTTIADPAQHMPEKVSLAG